jgi:undecaprenyl diphosphate synthase
LCIALNYGGRDELVNAFNRLIAEGNTSVTTEDIEAKLYTAGIPDPDLIVRTAGELRLSNFLMWQSAYSEFYFTDTLWPDMNKKDIDLAVREFYNRQRRYGKV